MIAGGNAWFQNTGAWFDPLEGYKGAQNQWSTIHECAKQASSDDPDHQTHWPQLLRNLLEKAQRVHKCPLSQLSDWRSHTERYTPLHVACMHGNLSSIKVLTDWIAEHDDLQRELDR